MNLERYLNAIRKEYDELDVKPLYKAAASEEIMLPMKDGVRLYTVVRKPEGAGPFPTIALRSCYPHQDIVFRINAEEYCKRGYAYVYQFCRGTGKSEGEWVPNVNDRSDGKETMDWLAAQDWVENIGYMGSSYLAFTGWVMADILPDKVKTLYLTHYGTDRFTSAYQNGLFRQDVLTSWAMGNAGFEVTADYDESVSYRPQIDVDKDLWGQQIDWYRDWITNTNRSDPYWQTGFWKELSEIPGKLKIPVYIGSGWYDHHHGSSLRTYEALSAESKAHSVLRIGAWNHGFAPCVEGIESKNLENSDVKASFNWFDAILRQKKLPEGMVSTYKIGADTWEQRAEFPFPQQDELKFYFSAKEAQSGAYMLTEEPNAEQSSVEYIYDPDNPLKSYGAESLLRSMDKNGSKLQPEPGWRSDVMSFISDPFTKDTDILGKIKVTLNVSSSAEDTAFTAKVMEVHPDGKTYNIRSGITTLAYRESPDQDRVEYIPDTVVEANIFMWDISWRLHRGSKLRIDISSSDSPQYAVHTNNAGIWALQVSAQEAKQTLHCGGSLLAHVTLPISHK